VAVLKEKIRAETGLGVCPTTEREPPRHLEAVIKRTKKVSTAGRSAGSYLFKRKNTPPEEHDDAIGHRNSSRRIGHRDHIPGHMLNPGGAGDARQFGAVGERYRDGGDERPRWGLDDYRGVTRTGAEVGFISTKRKYSAVLWLSAMPIG